MEKGEDGEESAVEEKRCAPLMGNAVENGSRAAKMAALRTFCSGGRWKRRNRVISSECK